MGKIHNIEKEELWNELFEIYGYSAHDWLHYPVTKRNIMTLHHIIKRCDGGDLSIDNIALLTKKAHQNLHTCEVRDIVLYNEINNFFDEIVLLGSPLDNYLINESINYKNALTRVLYKK